IYQRKDGRWAAQIRLPGGSRRTLYAETRRVVQLKLAAALRAREEGQLSNKATQTLSAYLQQWLENFAKPSVRASTYASYALHARQARELLGWIRLNELTPTHIQGAYATLLKRGLAPRTVWRFHMLLHR